MYVVIVGAGTVGSAIAESIADTHDVAVVDTDGDLIERLLYDMDILGVTGDGADIETLREAGIRKADLVIASTDDDETNLVVCGTVRTVSDAFTIARVKRNLYRTTWEASAGAFGVDYMVATNLLTAENIARIVGLPSAQDVETFAGGLVQMAEFEISPETPVADQTVEAADRYDSRCSRQLNRVQQALRNGRGRRRHQSPRGDRRGTHSVHPRAPGRRRRDNRKRPGRGARGRGRRRQRPPRPPYQRVDAGLPGRRRHRCDNTRRRVRDSARRYRHPAG